VKTERLRTKHATLIIALCFAVLAVRIVYLQFFRAAFLRDYASAQYYKVIPLEAKRGMIFDREGRILAAGLHCYSVFADPAAVVAKVSAARLLSDILGLPSQQVWAKLNKNSRFVWLKRRISWDDKEKIKSLNVKGVGFLREDRRFYPQDSLAASVLGAVNVDNRGIEGLEMHYDEYLRGKDGWVKILQDSASRNILLAPETVTPQAGADIMLTVDAQIQYWADFYLKSTVDKYHAKQGSVVVMDATNGEIVALSNYPFCDPNHISRESIPLLKNKAVTDIFEPGSVFKVVALMAALDTGTFKEDDQFFCENGLYKIPGARLHDWKPYGTLSFTEVFKKSSNIGVGKIVAGIGAQKYFEYLKAMRVGERTGADMPAESSGTLKPFSQWSKTSSYMVPIGQEVGVNLLQLARMFAVMVNGGYLVKPHIVRAVYFSSSVRHLSVEKERVIPTATANRARNILLQVVEDGTAKLAYVPGMAIGGKTGTAQKFDSASGRYSATAYRANFVGFLADLVHPVVIAVSVDEPQGSHFGGVVAAPLFKEVALKVAAYMGSEKVYAAANEKKRP